MRCVLGDVIKQPEDGQEDGEEEGEEDCQRKASELGRAGQGVVTPWQKRRQGCLA